MKPYSLIYHDSRSTNSRKKLRKLKMFVVKMLLIMKIQVFMTLGETCRF